MFAKVSDVLDFLSDFVEKASWVATILLAGFGVFTFWYARSRATRIAANLYAKALKGCFEGAGAEAREAFRTAVCARETRSWQIADEVAMVRRLGPTEAGAEWSKQQSADLAAAYDAVVLKLRNSLRLRVAGRGIVEREVDFALSVADYHEVEADFVPATTPALDDERLVTATQLELLFKCACKTTLLAGPQGKNLEQGYDRIHVELHGRDFGAPMESFRTLAAGGEDDKPLTGDWEHLGDAVRVDQLNWRVQGFAKRALRRPRDFNGRLVRLRHWRIEVSDSSPISRLTLLAQPTNFATMLATDIRLRDSGADCPSVNEGLADPPDPPTWSALRSLCLNNKTIREPWKSHVSNALAIHLMLLTSDHYLVMVRRSDMVAASPGLWNSAANGMIEIPDAVKGRGDFDDRGFVDIYRGAIREASEEIGTHLELEPEQLVVRALAVSQEPGARPQGGNLPRRRMRVEQVAPWVAIEARTALTFEEVVKGQMTHSSPHEGAYEVGGRMVGLPLGEPEDAVRWVLLNAEETTYSGVAGALLVLLPALAGTRKNPLAWALGRQRRVMAMSPEQRAEASRRLLTIAFREISD